MVHRPYECRERESLTAMAWDSLKEKQWLHYSRESQTMEINADESAHRQMNPNPTA